MFSSGPKVVQQKSALIHDISTLEGKIGIFGGSFDPIHADHLALANFVAESLSLDHLVFLPTPHNPLKQTEALFTDQQRVEILLEAIKNSTNLHVCTFEIDRFTPSKKTYTVDTLSELTSNKKPNSEIFFILGADCLPDLHRWHNFHELFKLSNLVPVARGNDKDSAISDLKKAQTLEIKEIDMLQKNWVSYRSVKKHGTPISSTEVRQAIKAGEILSELVPPGVPELLRRFLKK